MPNPTTTVKVLGADKGIRFFNPQTGKVEEVTENTRLPLNAVLEATRGASLQIMVDGKPMVVPVVPGSTSDIQSSIESVSSDLAEAPTDSDTVATCQPLPSLQTSQESSAADLKPARTGGFAAPAVVTSTTPAPFAADIDETDVKRIPVTTDVRLETSLVNIITQEQEKDTLVSRVETEILTPVIPQETIATTQSATSPLIQLSTNASITGITPDTGFSDKDHLTNKTQVTITGLAPGADSVELWCDNGIVDTVPVGHDSTWSCDWVAPHGTLDGKFNFIAFSIKSGIKRQPGDPVLVSLKTSKPALTIENPVHEPGPLIKPEIHIAGKTDAFNKATFKSGTFSETKELNIDGQLSFDYDLRHSPLGGQLVKSESAEETILEYQVEVEDAAGNKHISESHFYAIPTLPFNLKTTPDTGVQGDNITRSPNITVEGDALVSHRLMVKAGALFPVSVYSDPATGHWKTSEFTLPSEGKHEIQVWYACDSERQHMATSSITLDTSKPQFTQDSLRESVHSHNATPTFQIEAETGYTVRGVIKDSNGVEISAGQAIASSTAQLKSDKPLPTDGQYTAEFIITNPADTDSELLAQTYIVEGDHAHDGVVIPQDAIHSINPLPGSNSLPVSSQPTDTRLATLLIDAERPEQPTIERLSTSIQPDKALTTNAKEFDVIIRAEKKTHVQLYDDTTRKVIKNAEGVTDDQGQARIRLTAPQGQEESHTIYAKATDSSGNSSVASEPATIITDLLPPSVSDIKGASQPLIHPIDSIISITVHFSEDIYCQGNPKLNLALGNDTIVQAEHKPELATSQSLTFEYQVTPDAPGTANIIVPVDALELPGGTSIADNIGNPATLTLSAAYVLEDGINADPVVSGFEPSISEDVLKEGDSHDQVVSASTDKVTVTNVEILDGCRDFVTHEIIKFEVTFSKPVKVTGNPALKVAFGGTHKKFPFGLDSDQFEASDKLIFSKKVTSPNYCETGITALSLTNTYTKPFKKLDGTTYNKTFTGGFEGEDGSEVILAFDARSFPECKVNPVLITKADPVTVVDIQPASEATHYTTGQTVTLEVTTSSPVTFHADGDLRPSLSLLVNDKLVSAALAGQPENTHTLSFTFTVGKDHIDYDGIAPQQLEHSSLLKSASGALLQGEVDTLPLPLFVGAEYPQVISSSGVHAYDDHSVLFYNKNKAMLHIVAPAQTLSVSQSTFFNGQWTSFSERAFKALGPETESMNTYYLPNKSAANFNGMSFMVQLKISASESTQTSVYKVGFSLPSHHYSFDSEWIGADTSTQSLSYPSASTRAEVVGDVIQTNSPISLGHALEFQGGHLKLGAMTSELSDSFTLCAWLRTTVSGSSNDDPASNPALIGTAGSNGLYLLTVNQDGYAAIAQGSQYGASTSVRVNDGQPHHICLVSERIPPSDAVPAAYSQTQFFINGIADSPEKQPVYALPSDDDSAVEINVIGGLSTANGVIPWQGMVDDLKLFPKALSPQDIASQYTKTTVVPLDASSFQPLGMIATLRSKQLVDKDSLWFKFTDATGIHQKSAGSEELKSGYRGEMQCEYIDDNGNPALKSFSLEEPYQLTRTEQASLSQLKCQVAPPLILSHNDSGQQSR